MSTLTDLLLIFFRDLMVPLLLPVFLIAALVMMAGGRPAIVFRRSLFLMISLIKVTLRVSTEILLLLITGRKTISTRRTPPGGKHLGG